MRPHSLSRLHFSVSVVLFLIVFGSSFPARAKSSSDPRDLMKLGAKINGLNGLNGQPWNLRVRFKALGENGYLMDQGTYEETWFSPTKFKRSLIGAAQSLSDFGTSIGTLRSDGNLRPGDELKASAALNDIHLAMMNPLPADLFVKLSEARGEQRNVAAFNAIALICFSINPLECPKQSLGTAIVLMRMMFFFRPLWRRGMTLNTC